MFSKAATSIGKAVGDSEMGFKLRMNQHTSECSDGISNCKFPRHGFHCGTKNSNLVEPFLEANIMSLKEPQKLREVPATKRL